MQKAVKMALLLNLGFQKWDEGLVLQLKMLQRVLWLRWYTEWWNKRLHVCFDHVAVCSCLQDHKTTIYHNRKNIQSHLRQEEGK